MGLQVRDGSKKCLPHQSWTKQVRKFGGSKKKIVLYLLAYNTFSLEKEIQANNFFFQKFEFLCYIDMMNK